MDMRKCIYIILTVLAFTLYGCSDWLDVKPSDRVSEENAFSTLSGFKKALNGVYVELNQNELYGRSLTCEFVEILAQRYAIDQEASGIYLLTQYNYIPFGRRLII